MKSAKELFNQHTCHISRREEKTHGITGFLTVSHCEMKTSQKEFFPMLNFSQGNNFADHYFSRASWCCSNNIIGRKEKPITRVTGVLADINSGDKIKKVLKLILILHTFETSPRWQVLRLFAISLTRFSLVKL